MQVNSIRPFALSLPDNMDDRRVADYCYQLEEGEKQNILVEPESDGTELLTENVVNVAGELGEKPTYYYGREDGVDNTANSSTGNLIPLGDLPGIA